MKYIVLALLLLSEVAFAQQAKQAKVRRQDRDYTVTVNDGGVETTPLIVQGSTSRVGIGILAPEGPLHIKSIDAVSRVVIDRAGDGTAGLVLGNNVSAGGTDKYWKIGVTNASNTVFRISTVSDSAGATGSADRFVIDRNGNIGMGGTGPDANTNLIINESGTSGKRAILIGESTGVNPAVSNGFSQISTANVSHSAGRGGMILQAGLSASQIYTPNPIRSDQTIQGASFNMGGGVTNGSAIAPAIGRTGYLVSCSNNFSSGNSVRSILVHVLTNNEGTAVAFTNALSNINSMTVNFAVSGAFLTVTGLPAGNNQCGALYD